ncbi:hypothetical protein [Subtercola boreus]|uniref:hypothetical protein n=1 Tax=Subtercola boreus TaxID=120213 RepID=UPI0011C06F58|nr:hypothetical protein [Subtercola boreus]
MSFTNLSREIPTGDLAGFVGSTVKAFRVLAYRAPDGQLDSDDDGLLEITLAAGNSFHVTSNSYGEDLQAFAGSWIDPFAGPQSPANQSYLTEHGKWEPIDLTDSPPWQELVGGTIQDVQLMATPDSPPHGVRFRIEDHWVDVEIGGDKTKVRIDGKPANAR